MIAIGIVALAVGLICAAGCIYSLFQSRSAMERIGAVDAQAAKRFPARPSPAIPPGAPRFVPRSDLPPLESSAASQADQIEHFLISLNQREKNRITPEQLGVLKSLILNRARELAQQRDDWARSGIKNHWVGYAIMQQGVTLEVKLNRNDPEAYWVLPDGRVARNPDARHMNPRTGTWADQFARPMRFLKPVLWGEVVLTALRLILFAWLGAIGVRLFCGMSSSARDGVRWAKLSLICVLASILLLIWMALAWPSREVAANYRFRGSPPIGPITVIGAVIQAAWAIILWVVCRSSSVQLFVGGIGYSIDEGSACGAGALADCEITGNGELQKQKRSVVVQNRQE